MADGSSASGRRWEKQAFAKWQIDQEVDVAARLVLIRAVDPKTRTRLAPNRLVSKVISLRERNSASGTRIFPQGSGAYLVTVARTSKTEKPVLVEAAATPSRPEWDNNVPPAPTPP